MRHFLTFIFSLFFTFLQFSGLAQVPKKILVEQFSNTRCGICANRIPQLRQNMEPYKENIQLISYFSAAPYPSCELHQSYTMGNNARVSFYNVAGSPSVFVNGERVNVGSSIVPASYFEERLEETSPLEINVVHHQESHDAAITLTFHGQEPEGVLRLFAFVVEKEVTAPGALSNYRQHYNVLRNHLTPYEGLLLEGLSADVPANFDFSYDVQPGWNPDELMVVAFVQDVSTNEVWNASDSDQEPLTSLKERQDPLQLVLYPNPVGYSLYLKGELTDCMGATAAIYNSFGQLQRIIKNEELQSNLINVHDMASGNYFLKMIGSKCDCIRPFIIAR